MYLTSSKIFTIHSKESSPDSLVPRVRQLLEDQKRTWERLAEGYDALADVRTRDVACDGYNVLLQFNPRRIVSTGAKVDPRSIQARPCFLCVGNLPDAQRGILYHDSFLILCNPAPIFYEHLTISHVDHVPQEVEPHLHTMLDLARELAPGFTLFYNGPRCGASAPDHMHFQAAPTGSIPIEKDAVDAFRRTVVKKLPSVAAVTLKRYGRGVAVIESTDEEKLVAFVRKIFNGMRAGSATAEEPMVNILCSYRQAVWRMIVFPRKKHRPEVYFREGDAQVLISPAAVDVGGLIVTPVEKDFLTVDDRTVGTIFGEVCTEPEAVTKLLTTI